MIKDCDVRYFLGSTISKGKTNDNVFHDACLDHLIDAYQKRFQSEGRETYSSSPHVDV